MANPHKFDVAAITDIEKLCSLPIIMPPPSTPAYLWQEEYLKRHYPEYATSTVSPARISCGYSPGTGIQMVAAGYGVMRVPLLLAYVGTYEHEGSC